MSCCCSVVNCRLSSGATAAFLAAQNGHLPTLQHLTLEAGASLQIVTYDGMTSLHATAQNGHLQVVEWLVSDTCKKY